LTKKHKKIIVIIAALFLVVLFVIGLFQSAILNSLTKQKSILEQQYEQVVEQEKFVKTPDYQDTYARQEGDLGGENDEIYKIKE
jgi:uncharacterized protein YpmB